MQTKFKLGMELDFQIIRVKCDWVQLYKIFILRINGINFTISITFYSKLYEESYINTKTKMTSNNRLTPFIVHASPPNSNVSIISLLFYFLIIFFLKTYMLKQNFDIYYFLYIHIKNYHFFIFIFI